MKLIYGKWYIKEIYTFLFVIKKLLTGKNMYRVQRLSDYFYLLNNNLLSFVPGTSLYKDAQWAPLRILIYRTVPYE
ncbi:MAG: hypothetical protein APF77_22730 [Clostridia bacterium BRH_c25]|nr:MAG: hypothetical protein APF77_22730 [Clostridia bacterium BRH_c25]